MPVERRFEGQSVAIIGCATGLGYGMARQFAREGVRLALADLNDARLARLVEEVTPDGAEAVSMRVDVSSEDDVRRFAGLAQERFGHVDILCSNAGVSDMPGTAWEKTASDWNWVMGVNLYGHVNAVNAFIQNMLDRNSGQIVSTISNSALIVPTNMAPYTCSKKAGLGYCETLQHDLTQAGSAVTVSAVLPGKMISEMPDNMKSRPDAFPGRVATDEEVAQMKAYLSKEGLTPEEAARLVLDGIARKQFFILTHPEDADAAVSWAQSIAGGNLVEVGALKNRFSGLS